VLESPYRFIINRSGLLLELEKNNPDREIAVLVPELVVQRWYHYLLHNQRAAWLESFALLRETRESSSRRSWYLSS